jgi:DNA-directed RNA polymerase specialized sigma24 family protein
MRGCVPPNKDGILQALRRRLSEVPVSGPGMSSRQEDIGLIARIASGDDEAFGELYSRHERSVRGFIKSRADSSEDADDIAQDTWLAVRQKAATYDHARAGVSTFIRMLANTAIANFYRHRWHDFEVLFTELQTLGEKNGEDVEIGTLIAQLTPNAIKCAPEGMNLLLEDLLLRLVFEGPSPPHQMIAFGFVERLGWKPKGIVEDLSPRQLAVLEDKLEADYVATSTLGEDRIHARFRLLRGNLLRPLGDILTEPKTVEICKGFLNSRTGETILNQYFTHDPPQEIAHWCQAVTRRVASEIAHRKGIKIHDSACENLGDGP